MIKLYKDKRYETALLKKNRLFQKICWRLRLLIFMPFQSYRAGCENIIGSAKSGKFLVYMGLIVMFVFISKSSSAQSISPAVINSGGGSYSGSDIIYEWSIGELALVETMLSAETSLTNGLLQPVPPTQIITNGFIIQPANVLTPNGDGNNDTWVIKDLERYPDNEIRIFDRAGRLVYYVKGYQNNWKGTLNGAPLAEDSYYYIIKLTKEGQQSVPIKGFITIIH